MLIRCFIPSLALVITSMGTFVFETCSAEPTKPDTAKSAQDKKQEPAKEALIVPPRKGKSETIELFNGKNLDGWIGHEKHWSVQDGVIVGHSDEAVPVSTYLLTKRNFSDFRL